MSLREMTKRNVHLFQFNPASAADLFFDYEAGAESWWVNIDRNTDKVDFDNLVFFWVTGPSDKAGIIGAGVASGEFDELEHPKSYNDPNGPRALRTSTEIFLAWVGDTAILTRAEMKQLDIFADFDLFKMSRRPSAFTVNRTQAEYIIDRFKAVIGE